ncbi:MAG: carbamoyl phosphate synthase large subunit, partial [Candidatus Omnitrophota bacterium]
SLGAGSSELDENGRESLYAKLRVASPERIFLLADAFRSGIELDKVHELTSVDKWFLHNIREIVEMEEFLKARKDRLDRETPHEAKKMGFSDRQIALLIGKKEEEISSLRISLGIIPDFKLVDTCAAEFQAFTPYYYSTYDTQL